jgi:hypothetical protein
MADAQGKTQASEAAAPAKRRRAAGPRVARPVFAVVTYNDEGGEPVKLESSRLKIQIERDSAKLVEMLTSSGSFDGAAIVRVELPQPQRRGTGAQAEQAPAQ